VRPCEGLLQTSSYPRTIVHAVLLNRHRQDMGSVLVQRRHHRLHPVVLVHLGRYHHRPYACERCGRVAKRLPGDPVAPAIEPRVGVATALPSRQRRQQELQRRALSLIQQAERVS
jgi:hypothetical protein